VPILKTEAIILRTIDYSETSQIAWLFTRDHGRVHVLAKGARRPRSAFEGALEPLARGELVFYRKKRSDGLEIAKEFDLLDLHRGLRRDLARIHRGLYLAELLTELSEREAVAPASFDAASAALADLSRQELSALDAILFRVELALLEDQGLGPRLDGCIACLNRIGGEARGGYNQPSSLEAVWFSARSGGLLCAEHARDDPTALKGTPGGMKTLLALSLGQQVGVGPEVGREIRAVLDRFLNEYLGKELRLRRHLGPLRAASRARSHTRG